MCNTDIPGGWDQLVPQITALLTSDDEKAIFAGLASLKSLVRRLEFDKKEKREMLEEVSESLFPKIETMLLGLIDTETEESVRA